MTPGGGGRKVLAIRTSTTHLGEIHMNWGGDGEALHSIATELHRWRGGLLAARGAFDNRSTVLPLRRHNRPAVLPPWKLRCPLSRRGECVLF